MISDATTIRFWAKVQKAGNNECWLWTASVAGKGYGQFKAPKARRQHYAHRYSYTLHKGPIPKGMMVLHQCDTPRCVNPKHLFLGTGADNLGDMAKKDRHLYGERNNQHRLTEVEVHRIFDLSGQGWVQKRIAAEFGVGQMTVCRILRGERWHHVWTKRRGPSAPA